MSHIVLTVDGAVVFDNAPKTEVPTADRIREVIGQLRSQNTPWPEVAVFLQTWTLQRALSPAEWEVAYAAGFPRDPVPTPTPDNGPDLSGSVLEYAAGVYGRPISVLGSRSFTVTGAPAASRVIVIQASGKTAFPFVATVNGASKQWDNLQAECAIDAAGPMLSIAVSSAEGSNLQVFIRPA
jgi:hypothetical protein